MTGALGSKRQAAEAERELLRLMAEPVEPLSPATRRRLQSLLNKAAHAARAGKPSPFADDADEDGEE